MGDNNINNKIIENIINRWDPIGLFPAAPSDEYSSEIRGIFEIVQKNKNISKNELSKQIRELFLVSFGQSIFKSTESECLLIAEKIINLF